MSKENLNPWPWSNWLQLGKLNQFGIVSLNFIIDEFFRGEGLTLSMSYILKETRNGKGSNYIVIFQDRHKLLYDNSSSLRGMIAS